MVEATGREVVAAGSIASLEDDAVHAPFSLAIVDAATLAELGVEGIRHGLAGERVIMAVPIIAVVDRGGPALDDPALEGVDEVLREPLDAGEVRLRVQSGLARGGGVELLSAASHELRSPLQAIVTSLAVLARGELSADQRELVDGAGKASRHVVALVSGILDHARLARGPITLCPAPFAVRDLLGDAARLALDAAEPARAEITILVDDALPALVRGDAMRVRQIVVNLLDNALRFAVAGPVVVAARAAGPMLEIRVCDDGPGVAEPLRSQVFEPFHRPLAAKRSGGTGLGLAIARGLARQMGGDVTVGEGPDGGACFLASLRLLRDDAESARPDGRPLALLADADAIHRATLGPLLERLGYRLEVVTEGVGALLHAMEHGPALVLIDVGLPALGGLEVARRLRAAHHAMPIVGFAQDADVDPPAVAEAEAAGLSALIAKPVAPLQLQRALRRASNPPASRPRVASSPPERGSGPAAKLDPGGRMGEALRGMIDAVRLHGDALDAALARRELGVVADIARTLRAAVLALNARGLDAVLRDLEQAARAGDAEECRRAHEVWQRALGSLRDDVDRFLARTAGR